VPSGFAVNAEGYRYFIEATGLDRDIASRVAGRDLSDPAAMRAMASELAETVATVELPADLLEQVGEAYESLCAMHGLACAVRSSAIGEDSAGASFAGLYESYLNLQGITDVLDAVRRCYASLWSERALRYRLRRGGDITDEAMAVVVMGLVQSEASGIAFTAHPVTGSRDQVVINASWGLGEAVVSGQVTPDSFVVEKGSLALVEREIFAKEMEIYSNPDGGGTLERELTGDRSLRPSLSDDEAREVARVACLIEAHYGAPQDIEFGVTSGHLFILQSRPITTLG
jgi:pyruvate,water dikinase